MRNLLVVLGDQLDPKSAAFDGFDKAQDAVWMAEVLEESEHVWSHKVRIAMFLSAMRHFRDGLQRRGITVHYRQLNDRAKREDFASVLATDVRKLRPRRMVMVEPGEWRVRQMFEAAAGRLDTDLDLRPDRHFLCSREEFEEHAEGRKQLRLEFFYRQMRRRTDVLMEGDEPAGGKWNFDTDNRGAFGKSGPPQVPMPRSFKPDRVTREVFELIERYFADHPGSLEHFDWPVTPRQAKQALDDFVQHRLARFGQFQDAMWTSGPFLFHSLLSAALNLKLLDPRDVIESAAAAYEAGLAPLNAVEGFVRQVMGWREYVRGVYWLYMPQYLERNTLGADLPLPEFYWTGETEMNCLREVITQTLQYGYAHHIQRLMVTGLYALLLGVHPKAVHEWYLAIYVDAVEWVELPNVLGMSQYADDGVMASKPYAATGKYVQRMSNYCAGCRFKPAEATGDDACPFTTLYWDFLSRHERLLAANQRMSLQVRNIKRKSKSEWKQIREQAARWKRQADA
jgi:deoxyribodipyrimidine photolyase-related protein